MSKSVSIEIGDDEYEVEVESVDFGQAPSGWDPGASAEIELADVVKVWGMVESSRAPYGPIPGVTKRITLKEFIKIFADHEDTDISKAERLLEERCLESVAEQMEDDNVDYGDD